jgi:hypothetical protein
MTTDSEDKDSAFINSVLRFNAQEVHDHPVDMNVVKKAAESLMANLEEDGTVYFMHAVGTNTVKIGYTLNVESRLYQVRSSCPYYVRILFELPGSPRFEAELHSLFSKYKVRGEWFLVVGDLAAFIEQLNKLHDRLALLAKKEQDA